MTSMTGYTGSASGNRQTGMNDVVPKGYRTAQLQQFNPDQMQLFSQLFSHLGPNSFLSKLAGGDQSTFEEMEAPAMKQFQGLLGNMANRFSGEGMGGRHGSSFQMAGSQATSDFAQQLQSQRMGLQRQALQDLFGMSSQLFSQNPYDRSLVEKPMSFLKQMGLATAEGAGKAATMAAMA